MNIQIRKALAMVLACSAVGVAIGQVVVVRSRRAVAAPVAREPASFGSQLDWRPDCRAGILGLGGALEVGEPDAGHRPYAVTVKVRDGRTMAPLAEYPELIRGIVGAGEGHLFLPFEWSAPFPSGRYYVEVVGHDPARPHDVDPGEPFEGALGYSSKFVDVP